MTRCGHCRSLIIEGGESAGGRVYCSPRCYNRGFVDELAKQLPTEEIDRRTKEIYEGKCPDCGGVGPVDIHTADSVLSVVIVSTMKRDARICCRSCARKRQLDALRATFFFGWWSAFGLFLTPVAIVRNVRALRQPNSEEPSGALRRFVIEQLARELRDARRARHKAEGGERSRE